MFKQSFEIEADCKKVKTAFNRFKKKYPNVWEVWGSMFEDTAERGIEHIKEEDWSIWLYTDEEIKTHYMAIVLLHESQKIG